MGVSIWRVLVLMMFEDVAEVEKGSGWIWHLLFLIAPYIIIYSGLLSLGVCCIIKRLKFQQCPSSWPLRLAFPLLNYYWTIKYC